MVPTPSLIGISTRDDLVDSSTSAASSKPSIDPIYIAGFTAAGMVAFGLLFWLGVRMFRKKSRGIRDENRGGAFLSVRGLIKENGETDKERELLPETLQALRSNTFSRAHITSSVVLPEKAITQPKSTAREDVLDYHRASGAFPRPFAPRPFSFALSASRTPPPRSSTVRSSTLSFASTSSRYSVASATSSIGTHTRKVQQLFNPILPDELLLTRIGERVSVIQSFDDGWCVVGRENSAVKATTAKSPFRSSKSDTARDGVELGVVPAWCFVKPAKGLRAERPVRSSSLGITVEIENPGFSSRDEIISWSNF